MPTMISSSVTLSVFVCKRTGTLRDSRIFVCLLAVVDIHCSEMPQEVEYSDRL